MNITLSVLFNPQAGGAKKQGLTFDELAARFRDQGLAPDFLSPEPSDAEVEAALRDDAPLVVVGGDGTIQGVLQAAARVEVLRLGLVPAGTANHLADALGVPEDLEASLAVIAGGRTRRIDLAQANGTVFSQAGGVGFHASIFHDYGDQTEKRALDAVSAAFSALTTWTPQLVRVSLDGAPFHQEVTQVTTANTPRYGRQFLIAPDALLDDGLLDVVIIGALTKPELVQYATAVVLGTHLSLPKTTLLRARRVSVTTVGGDPLPVHADALPAGSTPALIEVLPGRLEVFAPEGKV